MSKLFTFLLLYRTYASGNALKSVVKRPRHVVSTTEELKFDTDTDEFDTNSQPKLLHNYEQPQMSRASARIFAQVNK